MGTILRTWSYQYQWLYDAISTLATISVGGEKRFRHLPLEGLKIEKSTNILDLCCGAGQTTKFLVQYSDSVTGLDASVVALSRAKLRVPQARYIEALAQSIPYSDNHFDLVYTSVALHEMTLTELRQIFPEVYRVLKPGGVFAFIDLHKPSNWLFWPPVASFMWLFETSTAWQLIETDLSAELKSVGFSVSLYKTYAGGSLQVVQAKK